MNESPDNQDTNLSPKHRESLVDPRSENAATPPLEASPEDLAEKTRRDAEAQEAALQAGLDK